MNRFKQKLADGGVAVGVTINFPSAGLAEFLGNLGVDAVLIDAEHGAADDRDVEAIAIACDLTGCASMLRAIGDGPAVEHYMGLGITGIQLPQARSADQVREVVEAVKYAPEGRRGLGNSRSTRFGLWEGGFPALMEASNRDTAVIVQIEDRAGIAAVPEVARIPGVDAIIVGETDLSNDFGVPGQREHPDVVAASNEVIRAATEAGTPVGLGANTPAELERALERGARLVISSAARCLALGATPLLEAVRAKG